MHYLSVRKIFLQYTYMKLLALAFNSVLLFVCVTAFGAPIYRAGEPVSAGRSVWHGELSGSYLFSSHRLENMVESERASRLQGVNGRALWAPRSWLAVGAEMTHLGSAKLEPAVESYKVNQVAGIVKLTLSPNTTPRFYVLAGWGKSTHKLMYDRSYLPFRKREPVEKDFNFWTVGLGVEADVWKIVFVGVEGTLTHYNKTQLTDFYAISSKTQTSLAMRVGLRF